MELRFTKRDGKYDELAVVRPTGRRQVIACPKQGIIPHDMIHYAVESLLTRRGFLSLVKDEQHVDFKMQEQGDEEAVERLVETFQAEMWSGSVAATDLHAMYELACEERGHGGFAVSVSDIEAIRRRLEELTIAWKALPTNATLTLDFGGPLVHTTS